MAEAKPESFSFDPVALEFDAWFDGEGKLTYAIELEAFRELLPLLPKPWFEIGVGSGRFAHVLGIEKGIDPAEKSLELARSRGVDVFCCRGEDIPLPDASFGTVFIITTLCFVADPLCVLKEAHRLLKAGGKVVVGDMLRETPWGQTYQAAKEKGHPCYKYATFYNYEELEQFLNQAGFVIERSVSTLFQKPGEVKQMEYPQAGYSPDAGFNVIVAKKV